MKLTLGVAWLFLTLSLGGAHLVLHDDYDLCRWEDGHCVDTGCQAKFANSPNDPHECLCIPLDKEGCEYNCECDPKLTNGKNEKCPTAPTTPNPWYITKKHPTTKDWRTTWSPNRWHTTRDWRPTTRYTQWRGTRYPQRGTTRDPRWRTTRGPQWGTTRGPQRGTTRDLQRGTTREPQWRTTREPQWHTTRDLQRGTTRDPWRPTTKYLQRGTTRGPQWGTTRGPQWGTTRDPSTTTYDWWRTSTTMDPWAEVEV